VSNNQHTYRSFHPVIADAYTTVHQWLNTNVQDANGYKKIDPRGQWKDILQKEDWKHIAFQYYYLFPSHYFKAACTLENIVGEDRLESWLKHKQRMCVLDIGCGAGAGSAAFLEAILQLKEKNKITNSVDILFIGVDPSLYAIGLYHQLMSNIKLSITDNHDSLKIDLKCVKFGFPKAITDINIHLKNELLQHGLPCLSNVLAMQLNVISPLSQNYRNQQKDYDELRKLGIPIDNVLLNNSLST
jgi:SAM-dependent methyltransferase